jgi:hypothetical protein
MGRAPGGGRTPRGPAAGAFASALEVLVRVPGTRKTPCALSAALFFRQSRPSRGGRRSRLRGLPLSHLFLLVLAACDPGLWEGLGASDLGAGTTKTKEPLGSRDTGRQHRGLHGHWQLGRAHLPPEERRGEPGRLARLPCSGFDGGLGGDDGHPPLGRLPLGRVRQGPMAPAAGNLRAPRGGMGQGLVAGHASLHRLRDQPAGRKPQDRGRLARRLRRGRDDRWSEVRVVNKANMKMYTGTISSGSRGANEARVDTIAVQ